MRLTLRTLLAYRDQVLEPKDAETLEQRLAESHAARAISDRITHLLANPLATPLAVDAPEFGLNPNDVASFLDDAMAVDRVADMERKCLDNSALLAEVASCHQILAKTMRAPTHVPSSFRHRIGGLWAKRNTSALAASAPPIDRRYLRKDAAHPRVAGPIGATAGTSPAMESAEIISPSSERFSRDVPSYLQQTDRQWFGPTLRLVALLAIFAVCVWQSIGSRQRLSELLDRQSNGWSPEPQAKVPPEPNER
jgi:hypothetical protein